jgi:hypothetical protein
MAEKEKDRPAKFTLKVDIQCGVCGSLSHQNESGHFPKFCPCCGAGMERYCLKCHKKADMFFEEWWPQDDECYRTYSPAKRCSKCNAVLELETGGEGGYQDHKYQN